MPALFTSTSMLPNVATVFATAAFTASALEASARIASAFPPLCSIALVTEEAAPASFAYVMATLAPSSAKRLAIAAPIPREPPVTSATFPSSFLDMGFLRCSCYVTFVRCLKTPRRCMGFFSLSRQLSIISGTRGDGVTLAGGRRNGLVFRLRPKCRRGSAL